MRFIQVGVGGFGRRWVDVLKSSPSAKVVGLVDTNPDALEAARQAGDYSPDICFSSLEEALDTVQADALVSATPPAVHRRDVTAALKAGLHCISEKPMAESLADCKAMLRAARKAGRSYTVSQNYRYRPVTWTMAKLIAGGRLGAVGQVKVDFYKGVDFGGGFRHDMDFPLIVDMSIHHFDLMRFITGLDAVNVRGTAWNPPWSNYKGDCSSTALFELTGGARLVYNASWCAKGQFDPWGASWQIECEKGTLVCENDELTLYDVPKLYNVKKTRPVALKGPRKEGQDYVLADFIKAVKKGERPATDVYDNIKSVAMVFATVKAMKTGRTVPILDKTVKELLKGVK
jgi:predicted dehydrogenase